MEYEDQMEKDFQKFVKPELRKPDEKLIEIEYNSKKILLTETELLLFEDFVYGESDFCFYSGMDLS